MSVAYDPAAWQNFYIMTGGAAAVLTGLLFVAMSLHATAIMANAFYRQRAISTLLSMLTQLVIAAAVLVPSQSSLAVGIETESAALVFVLFTIRMVQRHRASGATRSPDPAVRLVAEWIGWAIWLVLFLVAGISLALRIGGGFYLVAVAEVYMFGANVFSAWVLIAEVSD